MAIPNNPTITELCTEGLKKGGRVNPTTSDIADTGNIHFQEVKSDIYLKSPNHKSLEAVSVIPVLADISRYGIPVYVEDLGSIQLIDTPVTGSWRDTAQGGGGTYIDLATGFSQDQGNVVGRMVYLIGGTGSGQFAQIIGYNNTSKRATIEAAWNTLNTTWVSPDNTSQYLVENIKYKLWQSDKAHEYDTLPAPFLQSMPIKATVVGRQIWLNSVPNRTFAMPITFWYALDQLDETSTLFISHLRRFRSLWITGISTKVANRYDDKRYTELLNVYNQMLDMYGSRSAVVGQTQFQDL